ncbi:hypothetical protein FRB93_003121 [Tulasnella sp. JGI-2019a]|nr:hypothetical protein FRB93_003121 [Tulasnella sp. JGI-2019a]
MFGFTSANSVKQIQPTQSTESDADWFEVENQDDDPEWVVVPQESSQSKSDHTSASPPSFESSFDLIDLDAEPNPKDFGDDWVSETSSDEDDSKYFDAVKVHDITSPQIQLDQPDMDVDVDAAVKDTRSKLKISRLKSAISSQHRKNVGAGVKNNSPLATSLKDAIESRMTEDSENTKLELIGDMQEIDNAEISRTASAPSPANRYIVVPSSSRGKQPVPALSPAKPKPKPKKQSKSSAWMKSLDNYFKGGPGPHEWNFDGMGAKKKKAGGTRQ